MKEKLQRLADEFERSLWENLIDPWFPACVDPSGGFYQSFSRDWTRGEDPIRSVVFQSRMTWVAATLSEIRPDFRQTAEHGLATLADNWVHPSGAVFWSLDKANQPAGPYAHEHHTYGSSFTLYALAATARALESEQALELAQRVFHWLERHAYDPEYGGYFECTDSEGKPLLTQRGARNVDGIGTAYGQKSQNTHLHLVEAFAELARVWRDDLLLERLAEMMEILEVRLRDESGALHVVAERDWTPVPGRFSFGHDIEAAHLLLDAGEVLHGQITERTQEVAKALIEHSLRHGLDPDGGFFNTGEPDGSAIAREKVWWVQAEALLGLARGYELLGTDVEPLETVWRWIRDHQIDPTYGGWYDTVDENGQASGNGQKGHPWKAAYHDSRGLLFSARSLRRAAGPL